MMNSNEISSQRIDNRRITYVSIRVKAMTLKCTPGVLHNCPTILATLERDLNQCLSLLPRSTHDLLKRTTIWINESYRYGHIHRPKKLQHVATHHHQDWLLMALDIPDKVLGIEIYNCYEYLDSRNHWNGCGLILHEFTHLIHQIVLGLDCEKVIDVFGHALDCQLYDEVLRRDWAFSECESDAHYGTINFKEFFAEISVAYLCKGYTHLDRVSMDKGMEACSPPFMDTKISQRICQKSLNFEEKTFLTTQGNLNYIMKWFHQFYFLNHRQVDPCNKFYPFTYGQLKHFDAHTFHIFDDLWNKISSWKDPNSSKEKICCDTGCMDWMNPILVLYQRHKSGFFDDHSMLTEDENLSETSEGDNISYSVSL